MVHETRIIPLDGRDHVASPIKSHMGDARGHWEADTLVVETTNFRDESVTEGQTPTRCESPSALLPLRPTGSSGR